MDAVLIKHNEIHRHLLECPICLEHFDENSKLPRILPCQHTFCDACLQKSLQSDKLTCPKCCIQHVVENCNVAVFHKDNTRRSLMDIIGKKETGIMAICTQCDENGLAETKCSICDELLCAACTNAHKRTKFTAKHTLVTIDSYMKENENLEKDKTEDDDMKDEKAGLCQNSAHGKAKLKTYCLQCDEPLCDLCEAECHKEHETATLEKGYAMKREEMLELLNSLKQKDLSEFEQEILKQIQTVQDNSSQLNASIESQFDIFKEVIENKKKEVQNKVKHFSVSRKDFLEQKLEKLHELQTSFKNAISYTDTILENADKMIFFTNFKTVRDTMKRLEEEQGEFPITNAEIRYTQACTTEDLVELLNAISGEVHEYTSGETTFRDKSVAGACSLKKTSTEKGSEQFMEVLKSFIFGMTEPATSLTSGISETFRSVNAGTNHKSAEPESSLRIRGKANERHSARVTMTTTRGQKILYDTQQLRSVVQARFDTWGIQGDWELDDDTGVVMHSRQTEESEQCMQLLKESVYEKTVYVKKESMFIVESDKWLLLTKHLLKKYKDKVAIDIHHEEHKVTCYSTCTNALMDVSDSVMLFLRENDVQTMKLTFSNQVATNIMRSTDTLNKIRASYSQYCVDITKECDSVITIKGIGFGMGQAVRGIQELALKCASGDEKDSDSRFDSDEESDNDDEEEGDPESRFHEPLTGDSTLTRIEMVGFKGKVQAICFPGDDRMLYITEGDITELPVEAIVNAADSKLKHNGGLAKVIVNKGGRSIQNECTEHVSAHGQLAPGNVFCSKAGLLPFNTIIHAVGPKWQDGKSGETEQLENAVYHSLLSASRKRLASIAIPAIGTGAFSFPDHLAVKAIVESIQRFLTERPRSFIRVIYLCGFNTGTVRHFTTAVKDTFRDSDTVSVDVSEAKNQEQTADHRDARDSKSNETGVRNMLFI